VGWLDRFPGRKSASGPQALLKVLPPDQVEAGGETWNVTAVLFYRDATSEWPVVKIERGVDAAWIALEDGQIVRYDHVDLPVGPDGRASWNARFYARAEMGTATVSRVVGRVDVAVGDAHPVLPGAALGRRPARMALGRSVAERFRRRVSRTLLARGSHRQQAIPDQMNLVQGYGIAVTWAITFMVLAFIVRWVFSKLNLFSLRVASQRKDAAVGHVLRGLYIALAIISLAAIQSTRSLTWAVVDTVISMALVLVFFKIYDWLDPRDFSAELEADNRMLGLELEGLFIVLAAVIVGAMNFLGS